MARPRSMGSKETGQKARRLRASGFKPKDVPASTGPYILKEGYTGEKQFGGKYKISPGLSTHSSNTVNLFSN